MSIEDGFIILGTFSSTVIGTAIIAYYRRKAEVSVEREGISELTDTVESIKSTFLKELESVKANLNAVNSIASEQRTAIYEFNAEYYKWLHVAVDLLFFDLTVEEYNKLVTRHRASELAFLAAAERLLIFIEDNDLASLMNKVKNQTRIIAVDTIKCFHECSKTPNNRLNILMQYEGIHKEKMNILTLYLNEMRNHLKNMIRNSFKPVV